MSYDIKDAGDWHQPWTILGPTDLIQVILVQLKCNVEEDLEHLTAEVHVMVRQGAPSVLCVPQRQV